MPFAFTIALTVPLVTQVFSVGIEESSALATPGTNISPIFIAKTRRTANFLFVIIKLSEVKNF